PINTEIIRSEILRLRDEGATVILSTHNMGSVEEICDRIALINKSEKILEGGVSELRESKAGKRYNMTYQGSPIAFANALWTNYDLVKQVKVGESNIAEVHIQGEAELNDLLRSVIDHVELSNVERIIPSMNDIFIEEVGLKNLSHDE
ncbi:MAG: DUF4162 domain-containing protein, partial [Flavobacteriales bacterium]